MSTPTSRAEAHARDLARFQAIAMHAAEKAHGAIEATEDAGELHERLDAEALDEGFADEPVEAQIDRIADLLGLTGEPTRRYIPASLRRPPRGFRPSWGWDDEADDDDEEDEPEDPAAVAAGSAAAAAIAAAFKAGHGAAAPSAPVGGGRLAPPMDLPSWDRDDDTS